MILWGVAILLFLLYDLFMERINTLENYLIFITFFASILQLLVKSVLNVRCTNHYKNITVQLQKERIVFIIFCLINGIFVALVVAFCGFVIIPVFFAKSAKTNISYGALEYERFAFYISVLILALTGCVTSVLDFFLLKAIRKKYYDSLIIMGESIGEHLEA